MQTEQAKAQTHNQPVLKDSYQNYNLGLPQLLPQPYFKSLSQEIKRNCNEFIMYCIKNKKIVKEMIDRGVKTDTFNKEYDKNLALFSVEILSGDIGQSHRLFIQQKQKSNPLQRANSSEIQEQIEGETAITKEQFVEKYSNLLYLFEYIERPKSQISSICINYLVKILTNLITNQPFQIYTFLWEQHNRKISQASKQGLAQKNKIETTVKSSINNLIDLSKNFPGISQMLGKLIAEQGNTNQYLQFKKYVIQRFLGLLRTQQYINANPDYYQMILDFVAYVFSRNKYKSDDNTEQLSKISQRFVDEDVIWFFKQKMIKSAMDANKIYQQNSGSSGNISRGQSCKSFQALTEQGVQEVKFLENIFENSLAYLKMIVDRLNSDEQNDGYLSQSIKIPEPTMDFQVDEAIYGETSFYQLMTLSIPFSYKNINKMTYYQMLLKLTRNSRYTKVNSDKHMGLQGSFIISALTHLLKTFRKQCKGNGLVQFYIQELIAEAILPKIQKLDANKQAMMVISAFNPSKQNLTKYQDYRVFAQKLLIILESKCQWFGEHFSKLGVNLKDVKQQYKVKLGGNSTIFQNRKNGLKQFQFIFDGAEELKKSQSVVRSQKQQDDFRSQSSDDQKFKDDMADFNSKRQFEYPQSNQKKWSSLNQGQQKFNSITENYGSLNNDSQIIIQQINIDNFGSTESKQLTEQQQQKRRHKQSEQIVLQVDSAGEDNQYDDVIREDMKQDMRNNHK